MFKKHTKETIKNYTQCLKTEIKFPHTRAKKKQVK